MKTNLRNVIKFEILRNLKKRTFWIAALILPLLFIGYIAFAGFTGYNTSMAAEQSIDTSDLKLGLYDAASYLTTDAIADANGATQNHKVNGQLQNVSPCYNLPVIKCCVHLTCQIINQSSAQGLSRCNVSSTM